jgi:hypothetical protein
MHHNQQRPRRSHHAMTEPVSVLTSAWLCERTDIASYSTGGIDTRYYIKTPLPMKRFYEEKIGQKRCGDKIQSGGARSYQFKSSKILSERTSLEITSAGQTKAYVMGWIEYADDVGTRRRTAFCRRYDSRRRL